MITRRSLAAIGGLVLGSGGAAGVAAQGSGTGPDAGPARPLFSQLDRARIAPEVSYLVTGGDTVAGVGVGAYATRRTGSPHARTFTAADGRVFELLPGQEGWSITAYGARDDGDPAQNHEAIQRLIHHALWLERNGFGTQQIVVDPGQYAISRALEIFVHDAASGEFDNVSLSITSPARGYVGSRATSIRNVRLDQPTVVIAKARSVKISNLSLVGANAPYQPSYSELFGDPGWSNRGPMRASQWSPACGIVIDPFGSAPPPDGGYPGLGAYYTSAGASSSNIIIENVEAQGFPAGIVISPSTDTQIGDSITIRDCNLSYNTYPVSTCQSQNRAVHVETSRIHACHVAISTDVFGNQDGSFPHVSGLNVTFARYLLSGIGGIGSGSISDCAVESTFALGSWRGAFALDVRSCHIKLIAPRDLYPPAENGSPSRQMANVDWHLFAEGPVNFFGGYFGFYSNTPVPLTIVGGGLVNFHGTALDCPVTSASPSGLHYDNAPLRYVTGGTAYGVRDAYFETETALAASDIRMPPGALVHATGAEGRIYRNRTGMALIALDIAALEVTGDGRASFATRNGGRYQVDEWLSTTARYAVALPNGEMLGARGVLLGQVAAVSAGRVTLRCVPKSLKSGSYPVGVQALPPFRCRAIGAASAGGDTLTGVVPPDHGFRVGDRLLPTPQIAEGTWIKAVSSGRLRLSQPATSAGLTQIKTADLQLISATATEAPKAGVTFAGDYIENRRPAPGPDGRIVRGWLATTDGDPGVLAPQSSR